jgi:hypothetical protein
MFRRITVGLKAQGRDFAGRKRSRGSAAGHGGWCSRLRTGLSCPLGPGAVGGCWIMLARLLGCATAGGSWRWCVCGPPVSAGPGSGIRPPSRGRPPPRRCACNVSCAPVCASALAVAAAASSTARRTGGSSHLAAAAAASAAAVHRAVAAALSAGLCRSSVRVTAGSGPAAAEALAALAGQSKTAIGFGTGA